ncbi:MAG: 1-acyl-sn-glycerol-3-phosphate acyltransferase [Bacteroidetes bacterium]|nr:1-acyl-sn-glycerol-3-phosphate acyltransferase [Bacteroidota bacterium]
MKSRIANFILKQKGWKIDSNMPADIKKAVVIMAPHTSYYDFVYGWLAFTAYKFKGKFMIKKESFAFPFGPILKSLGGIPVDRSNSRSAIKSVHKAFENSKELYLVVTPEGTRKLVTNWKKGFYHIAKEANVPIVCGYLDYKLKTGGFGPVLNPSDDYEVIMKSIQEFYKGKGARHPEKFNLSQ